MRLIGLFLATSVGCHHPALVARLSALEAEVAALKAVAPGPEPRVAAADHEVGQAEQVAAADLLKAANIAHQNMDFELASEILDELMASYPRTRAARAALRLQAEVAIIGEPAGELEIELWYQGAADYSDAEATLLVFWEVWCPHCKREMPKLEPTYQTFKDRGLQVVGVTKQTRDVDVGQVEAFIEDHRITYPMAKEAERVMTDRFAVTGVPAAAVVKNGRIVWRGHPARITDAMIADWIE